MEVSLYIQDDMNTLVALQLVYIWNEVHKVMACMGWWPLAEEVLL